MNELDVDTCLQCEQTRAQVKANDTICGIQGGYEYRELEHEWPQHHWRDWSNSELHAQGIKHEFFAHYSRASALSLPYANCEHTERGHRFPKEDVYWGDWLAESKDVCMLCGKRKENDD